MNQSKAPLWEALVNYAKKEVIPFHTPGHKLRSGVFPNIETVLGKQVFAIDPSDEVQDVSGDRSFEQLWSVAEELAAKLFMAHATRFLINGTSVGIHAMLMLMDGDIIVPRFSHQSVYAGLLLSRAKPIYLDTEFDLDWNIPLPPSLADIRAYLGSREVNSIFLTYPTYYGTTSDLKEIISFAKANQITTLVDEAHGGHFGFSDIFPKTALELGADLVVQSTHKTLGSLTQSSMLHIGNPKFVNRLDSLLSILQTTSPSLIMLGVLDEVRRELACNGKSLLEKALELAEELKRRLSTIPGIELMPDWLQQDPTKIVFRLTKLGLSGIEVEHLLRKDYNIQVELSDYYNVLALVTLGDNRQSIESLYKALADLSLRFKGAKPLMYHDLPGYPGIPQGAMDLKTAFYSQVESVPLAESKGRISSVFLTPYPPGVPVVIPGEIINIDIIEYLTTCFERGWDVRGLVGKKVMVIKE